MQHAINITYDDATGEVNVNTGAATQVTALGIMALAEVLIAATRIKLSDSASRTAIIGGVPQ